MLKDLFSTIYLPPLLTANNDHLHSFYYIHTINDLLHKGEISSTLLTVI